MKVKKSKSLPIRKALAALKPLKFKLIRGHEDKDGKYVDSYVYYNEVTGISIEVDPAKDQVSHIECPSSK